MNLADIEAGGSPIVIANGSARPTGGSGPVERIALARPVLPCPGCAHAPVCSIRPLLDDAGLAFRTPPAPHSAIHVRLTVEVECDHFLASGIAPEPLEASARPPEAARQAESRKRGTAAQVAARAAKKGSNWTPEMRARQSELIRERHAAKVAK